MKSLTQAELKSWLRYDAGSGLFYWRKSAGSVKAGAVAGCFDPNGNRVIGIGGNQYQASRLVYLYLNGSWPVDKVGHSELNKSDNRIFKLHHTNFKEAARKKRLQTRNSSGVTGVRRRKDCNSWEAYIGVNNKLKYLGCFKNKIDAVEARSEANIKYGFHPLHGIAI